MLNEPWDPTPRREIENREELIVNNNAQYCSVVRTAIGRARLVIGGEVDASMSKGHPPLRHNHVPQRIYHVLTHPVHSLGLQT